MPPQDDRREARRRDHDDRRQHVGKDVADGDPHVARAERLGALDVRIFLDRQRDASNDPGVLHAEGDTEDGGNVPDRRTEQGHDRHQEQERRKRHPRVDPALQPQVEAPAEISREHADRRGQNASDQYGAEADVERDARAVDQARQEIAAELIGPEPVRAVHRDEALGQARLREAVRRDDIREHRGREHDHHDGAADRAERLLAQHLDPDVGVPGPRPRRYPHGDGHRSADRGRRERRPAATDTGSAGPETHRKDRSRG